MAAIVVALAAVIAIAVYAWIQSHKVSGAAVSPTAISSLPPRALVGTPAPAFSVQTPSGPISNRSFAGKTYLLELFATWCPHCQRETSVFRALRVKYPESKLAMLSVSASPLAMDATAFDMRPSSQADVDRFVRRFKVTWPTAYDPTMAVAKAWGLQGFPTTFIVDRHGTIVYAQSGETNLHDLSLAVDKALRM